jgi:hypothetical protein
MFENRIDIKDPTPRTKKYRVYLQIETEPAKKDKKQGCIAWGIPSVIDADSLKEIQDQLMTESTRPVRALARGIGFK